MKRMITLFAATLALSACGADPVAACEAYIASAEACANEAAGTGTTTASVGIPDGFCDAYDSLKGDDAKTAADALNCAADAYDAADCSDFDAYTTAATDAGVCIVGG